LGWPFYFLLLSFNLLFPQLLWIKKFRRSAVVTILISIIIIFPSYIEYLVQFIMSFHKDFLPSKWIYAEPWYIRHLLTPLTQAIVYAGLTYLILLVRRKINLYNLK
jgi:hypothetical protein